MDFHVCDYLGEKGTHLCYNDATPIQQGGHSSGLIRFFDNSYTEVSSPFGATNGLIAPDIHELNTPAGHNGTSLLQIVYRTHKADLSAFGGSKNGYALSGCFQDIDISSRHLIFQWCSLRYVPIADTYVTLKPKGTNIVGLGNFNQPYDYFHINSVDKDLDGNYYISGRHTDTIYKIAGNNSPDPGHIIWRLGGKYSSFKMVGNLNFTRQHMMRQYSDIGNTNKISLFNNAFDGGKIGIPTSRSALASSGMLIDIDEKAMTATLTAQYIQPDRKLAFSQGAMSILENGNAFIGWGSIPSWSEYDANGTLLYSAKYTESGMSFRAYKQNWVGTPAAPPNVLAYAQNCSSPMVIYVSWNGATEVATWKVYASDEIVDRPMYSFITEVPRTGFETVIMLNHTLYKPAIYVEAIDKMGNLLRGSDYVSTFVPTDQMKPSCNATMCVAGTNYTMDTIFADCSNETVNIGIRPREEQHLSFGRLWREHVWRA